MGFDMLTESVRRRQWSRRVTPERPAASGRVILVQERTDPQNQQPGFLIYAPVYRKACPSPNEAELTQRAAGICLQPLSRSTTFSRLITAKSSTT